MKYKFLLVFLAVLLIMPMKANAYFPGQHVYIAEVPLATCTTTICNEIKQYPAVFEAGIQFTDASVFRYVTSLKDYQDTHSFETTYIRCLKAAGEYTDLKVFCYGMIAHDTADINPHNIYVPKKIKEYKIPIFSSNVFLHPIIELNLDKRTPDEYRFKASHALDIIYQPSSAGYTYLEFTHKFLPAGLNLDKEVGLLQTALGNGNFNLWDASSSGGSDIQGKIIRSIWKFVDATSGIFIDTSDADQYIEASMRDLQRFYNGEVQTNLDPAGTVALKLADTKADLVKLVFTIIIILFVLVMLIRYLIKHRAGVVKIIRKK